MIEVNSMNQTVASQGAVDFNDIKLQKGQTVTLSGTNQLNLNCKGVYKLECYASLAESSTLQLFTDGVADGTSQGTGTNIAFGTLISVNSNNYPNVCFTQPVKVQIKNTGGSSITLGAGNVIKVVVTKIC